MKVLKLAVAGVALMGFLEVTGTDAADVKTLSGPGFADSPTAIRPLLVGSSVPDAKLLDTDGVSVELSEAVAEAPSVLIFYRGGW
jgi:hypothetical protein